MRVGLPDDRPHARRPAVRPMDSDRPGPERRYGEWFRPAVPVRRVRAGGAPPHQCVESRRRPAQPSVAAVLRDTAVGGEEGTGVRRLEAWNGIRHRGHARGEPRRPRGPVRPIARAHRRRRAGPPLRRIPRHVTSILPDRGDGNLEIYNPAHGRVREFGRAEFASHRLQLSGWTVPWFVVQPVGLRLARRPSFEFGTGEAASA